MWESTVYWLQSWSNWHNHNHHHHHHGGLSRASCLACQSSLLAMQDSSSDFWPAPISLVTVSTKVVSGHPRPLCPCEGSQRTKFSSKQLFASKAVAGESKPPPGYLVRCSWEGTIELFIKYKTLLTDDQCSAKHSGVTAVKRSFLGWGKVQDSHPYRRTDSTVTLL